MRAIGFPGIPELVFVLLLGLVFLLILIGVVFAIIRVAWLRKHAGSVTVILAVLMGVLIGIGSFTFGYGEGASYLSNDPNACANCHVMQGHLDSWQHSSHRHVAVCNDCHLPHNFAGKWITKADNGFFHSLAFTTESFHEPIQIKPRNRRVTQNACLHCHSDFVHSVLRRGSSDEALSCVHCHENVGHAFH